MRRGIYGSCRVPPQVACAPSTVTESADKVISGSCRVPPKVAFPGDSTVMPPPGGLAYAARARTISRTAAAFVSGFGAEWSLIQTIPKPKPRWELHFATMAKARQV